MFYVLHYLISFVHSYIMFLVAVCYYAAVL